MKYHIREFPVKNSLKAFVKNWVLRSHVPIFLSLDITHRCNARCPFCGFWKSGPTDEMTAEEIKKVLKDGFDLGCILVTVTGGEPLLRKDIPIILEHAKSIGLSTFLLTNGYLLSDRIHEIHKNLDVVSVSIDFPDSRHDKTRGINGLLEKAITGINLAQEYGVTANINSIITRTHTLEDVENLIALARDLNCGITFAPIFSLPESCEQIECIGTLSEEGEKMKMNDWNMIHKIADRLIYYKNHGYWKTIQNTDAYLKLIRDQGSFTCYPLSLQIAIAPNGIVGAVCPLGLNEYNLGNALEQNLKEMWYSEKAENLREQFKRCKMARQIGCYLLCVAEFSLLYAKPSIILDYAKRLI